MSKRNNKRGVGGGWNVGLSYYSLVFVSSRIAHLSSLCLHAFASCQLRVSTAYSHVCLLCANLSCHLWFNALPHPFAHIAARFPRAPARFPFVYWAVFPGFILMKSPPAATFSALPYGNKLSEQKLQHQQQQKQPQHHHLYSHPPDEHHLALLLFLLLLTSLWVPRQFSNLNLLCEVINDAICCLWNALSDCILNYKYANSSFRILRHWLDKDFRLRNSKQR